MEIWSTLQGDIVMLGSRRPWPSTAAHFQTVYDRPEPGLIEFLHTEIDSSLQEHGLGSALAAGALDDVRASSTDRVAAICPFISGFIRKHPEYADLRTR